MYRGPLKNVTTSFSDVAFTRLALKTSSITFTTDFGLYWCLDPVNPINNSSRLNSQMIDTNDCYQLLLQIVIEVRNCIVPWFGEGVEKGAVPPPPLLVVFPYPLPVFKFCSTSFFVTQHDEFLTPSALLIVPCLPRRTNAYYINGL